MHKQFGGKVTKAHIHRYEQSPQWREGSFKNSIPTGLTPELYKIPGIICKQIKGHPEGNPPNDLPVASFEKQEINAHHLNAQCVWYGHSALYIYMAGKSILIDPMFGGDTSPIAPITTPRFSKNTLSLIDALPTIDLILITHDHYDHLDYASIQKLISKTKQYFVALGVKRHLVHWGVEESKITEFDWWDSKQLDSLQIHFTPTRHFSGRGLTDRAKTLWGGWALISNTEKLWFSGDGGYGRHFKEVGDRLGPFDLGFMECGQYSPDWHDIHLFPEESVRAALDGRVKKAVPVHWAGFNLSYHHAWYEPGLDFARYGDEAGLNYGLPYLGTVFTKEIDQKRHWWEEFR